MSIKLNASLQHQADPWRDPEYTAYVYTATSQHF